MTTSTNLISEVKRGGLAELIGQWNDFEEIADYIDTAFESRQMEGDGRQVSL